MAPKKSARTPDPREALALMQQGRVRGHGRRSPIVVWMQKHRATLEQGFTESAPSWGTLAAYLGEHGILDGDGKLPTAEATRQAWYRTKNMHKAKVQVTAPAHAPPSVQPSASPVAVSSEDNEPERPRFAFATLRNHTPPEPTPAAPVPPPDPVKQDADAAIRRLLGNKPRRGFRPPDQQD